MGWAKYVRDVFEILGQQGSFAVGTLFGCSVSAVFTWLSGRERKQQIKLNHEREKELSKQIEVKEKRIEKLHDKINQLNKQIEDLSKRKTGR